MKITKTKKLSLKYPDSTFYAISVTNLKNSKKNVDLEKEKKNVENYIKKNIKNFSDQIKERSSFFSSFNKSFPIEYQLNSISKGKGIGNHSTIKDLFFITELKNCVIMSAQDLDKLDETITFDLSNGNEEYVFIDGKKNLMKQDDIILKQKDEVLISHLYGPGKSTLVDKNTKNVLFMVWSDIKLSKKDLENIHNDIENYTRLISTETTEINVIKINQEENFIVTPWDVKGDIDYEKLIKDFGTDHLTNKILKRLEKHTGKLHHFLRRKKFFSHRDFDKILDHHEKGKEFALYTGRGPSGDTHLGHLLPWIFTKWLQDKFDVELYFEITDVEKYLVKDLTMEQTKAFAYENILDIIALGFNPKKTFIFLDSEYGKTQYKLANLIAKKINFSTAKAVFGFNDQTNIGLIFHPAVQATPCYLPTYLKGKQIPVLIPAAIDQDPYWRVTRDIAKKIGFPKPTQIHCSFFPGLKQGGKMSASDPNSAIYTTDNPKTVRKKIMKYAFSGGRETVEEHRKLGGNPDIDMAYQYLTFMEPDDKKLEKIYNDYKSGKLLSGEIKQIAVDVINDYLAKHQKKRIEAKQHIEKFMLRD